MTERLKNIFSYLPETNVFADIGCDHGYISQMMLESDRCNKAVISDISKPCLEKAERLLSRYIKDGRCRSVVSDGFDKVGHCDLALIAGMGGEKIVSILKNAPSLPEKLVLQPMKNCDKVRVTAVECGYKIVSDRVFKSEGLFYDIISLEKGSDILTKEEIDFGRNNIIELPDDFVEMIRIRINKLDKIALKGDLKKEDRKKILSDLKELKKYVKD